MDYIIKDRSGKESAPINESLLKDMARRGDISPKDQIRNSMVSDYKPASKVNCIKALLKNYKEVVDTPKIAKNLHRSIATINPPTLVFRLGATFIDTLILAVLILASFNFLRIFGSEFLEEGQQEALFLVSLFAIPLLYYTLTLGYKAQTVGFWYYGIMVIRGEGDPVLLARSFFLAFFYLLFLPLAPIFILFANKGLHEILSGSRVVKVRMG